MPERVSVVNHQTLPCLIQSSLRDNPHVGSCRYFNRNQAAPPLWREKSRQLVASNQRFSPFDDTPTKNGGNALFLHTTSQARHTLFDSLTTNAMDAYLKSADTALRTLFATPLARRECPTVAEHTEQTCHPLSLQDRALSSALMRVNHVGEVCAQALYSAQALATRSPALRAQCLEAAREETDHLAWTRQRLDALGARPSLLNPLWYAGAFGLGYVAGKLGDRVSLGFVVETEQQVEAHLADHLERLPAQDHASRAVVAQMKDDEARHAREARQAGAAEMPAPVKGLMRAAAKLMTTVAHRI